VAGSAEQKRAEMKFFVVLIAICALSQSATAQTGECKSIPESRARLACYDKAVPPPAAPAAAKAALQAAPASKVDATNYVDTISAEDKLMNARLRNICRGC
jgi:hypothetical protein